MSAPAVENFVSRVGPLIELERETEIAQTQDALQKGSTGQAASTRVLHNLRCTEVEAGLLGRSLLTLVNNKGGGSLSEPLPQHKFSSHDIVDLRSNKAPPNESPLAHGVVFRIKDNEMIIACDELPEGSLDQPLRLEKLANEVTYNRLKETLSNLTSSSAGGQSGLIDVAFANSQPRFVSQPPEWAPHNRNLDESQVAAVDRALAAQDVALIHGPPGTGKTTAVIEYILQATSRGNKVLATAASNMAVDNLVERLVRQNPKLNVVRVGHPARLLPQVLDSCLEAHILRSDNSALAKDCRKEIKQANHRMAKLGRKDYAERRSLRAEIRILAKEERKRQNKAMDEVLSQAPVVCATLTGVLGRQLDSLSFDVTVVDEAAQATEVATWAALLKSPSAVLAGDHLQLPPTIISEEAARKGLGETLFEKLHKKFGEEISTMLTVQYRMHQDIMSWSSNEMYGGKLQAHASVADHRLFDLQGVKGGNTEEMSAVVLIDTAGCDMEEDETENSEESKRNPGEAKVALQHCVQLLKDGVRAQDIGIITPYSAQVALLKEQRPLDLAYLEIGTVDGFQGREKEAIVISMVRSNAEGNIGFLADNRRMNVAVTRARRHCALICDTETVGHDPFLKRLTTYFEQTGTYMSAAEYDDFSE